MNYELSIILILLIIISAEIFCNNIIFKKLLYLFGFPANILMDNSIGFSWNLIDKKINDYDVSFKNILYFPKFQNQSKYPLILNKNIKLFDGFNNVYVTKKAIQMKIIQLINLSNAQINYNIYSKIATIKSDTIENIFSLGILLDKIASSEISLLEIKSKNLINQHEKLLRDTLNI